MTTAAPSIRNQTRTCHVCSRLLAAEIDIASLSEVFSTQPGATILGGNSSVENGAGLSYWMCRPVEVFEAAPDEKQPLKRLEAALARYRVATGHSTDLPKNMFGGGWVGYFAYELGAIIEPAAFVAGETRDDLGTPLVRLCFYDRLIAYDHLKNEFRLIALELSDDRETPEDKFAQLEDLLARAKNTRLSHPTAADLQQIDFAQIRSNMTRDYYFAAFKKIKRHIYDGDVYQINFSQRFERPYSARPIDLFGWQNHHNPSPYSAYIDAGDFQIVSASPEMFISIRDGVISTKPIKGTRPRRPHGPEQTNAASFAELLASPKEQAELNMIIDLERNDLARICTPGTRYVSQPRTIETFPTVFHAVATVEGELRRGITFCDILKAMFPGGSITGAPKIRAMQIINETEPTARGVYTGGIGYIGLDGSACLNIAIRTVIIRNKTAYVQTGGGIVADSDPQAEYDETLVKARALLAGIAAINRV